jgi:homocysteine S-methyltransferase
MKEGQQLFRVNRVSHLVNPFSLAVKINRPLILDGAMGSLLHNKGFEPDPDLWFSHLNIENPPAVTEVHKAYIEAGADIVTTNTFRTNPAAVSRQSKYSSEELIKAAVRNAKEAVSDSAVFIAGSNPPAEDSYKSERTISIDKLQYNHQKHIELLMENGCSFILNETQSHFDEVEIICRFCFDNKISQVVSLYFDENFRLLSGENVFEVLEIISGYQPLSIGFNCINIALFKSFLLKLQMKQNWGFYLNFGTGSVTDKELKNSFEPEAVNDIVRGTTNKNLSFIGGCCGSGPKHINYIRELIYGNHNS